MLDVSGAIAIVVANLRTEVGNDNRVPWVHYRLWLWFYWIL